MRAQRKLNQARELRKNSTPAEARLWEQLRNRRLDGFKFVRQATLGPYIADFLCREKNLVIELDGWTHSTAEEIEHDLKRTAYLKNEGYRGFRFDNVEALEGTDQLLVLLLDELKK